MKKSDVAEKQEHDREEWQKHGVGGVVKSVDPLRETSRFLPERLARPPRWPCMFTKDTIIRRYAPDSVKFDDAKPGTLTRSRREISFALAAQRTTMAKIWRQPKLSPALSAVSLLPWSAPTPQTTR